MSLIPTRLDATARGQALAAVFCATLPMGILQSSSTQNDYQVAYWLACLVVGADRAGWTWVLAVGAALGLATFTKATAYVFALPFLVLLAVRLLRNAGGVGRLAAVAALAGVVAVGLNAGQFARNQDLYGTPFGPDGEGAPAREQVPERRLRRPPADL